VVLIPPVDTALTVAEDVNPVDVFPIANDPVLPIIAGDEVDNILALELVIPLVVPADEDPELLATVEDSVEAKEVFIVDVVEESVVVADASRNGNHVSIYI
jgi:hypothetical protein